MPTVVHGTVAAKGQFPYVGYLEIPESCTTTTNTNKRSAARQVFDLCGSSLILPRVIATAGHCPTLCDTLLPPDALPGENLSPETALQTWSGPVIVSLNRWNITAPKETGGETRTVTTIVRNPGYEVDANGDPYMDDISLMSFAEPSAVTPVRVSTETTFANGTEFTVAGWGDTEPQGSLSPVIR